jgi:hypothetical protein
MTPTYPIGSLLVVGQIDAGAVQPGMATYTMVAEAALEGGFRNERGDDGKTTDRIVFASARGQAFPIRHPAVRYQMADQCAAKG